MTRKTLFVVLFLCAPLGAAWADTGCDTCPEASAWETAPPFEQSHMWIGAYTLGLQVGDSAPDLDAMDVEGQRAILAFHDRAIPDEHIATLTHVASNVDLTVRVVLSGASSATLQGVREWATEDVRIVADPLASILRIQYRVGEFIGGSGGVTFLVNEDGNIVYRRRGAVLWLMYEDFAIARAFSEHGDVPSSFDREHVLSTGDTAPMPAFPLLDAAGDESYLPRGKPLLIYLGIDPRTERGSLIFEMLEEIRPDYPEVLFVWYSGTSRGSNYAAALWALHQKPPLLGTQPEWFALPYEEYMRRVESASREEEEDVQHAVLSTIGPGWSFVADPEGRLITLWCLVGFPSLMILDEDHGVRLPYTMVPTTMVGGVGGELLLHPQAETALREILSAIVSGE